MSRTSAVLAGWSAAASVDPARYGESADMVSCELTFWFVGLVTLTPLPLLILFKTEKVDRARQVNAPQPAEA